jgi:hypothetical protein
MKELLPEVVLRLGRLEERVRTSVGQPRLWNVSIVRRHHQLMDSAHLPVDESSQLRGAVALGRCDCGAQQRKGNG